MRQRIRAMARPARAWAVAVVVLVTTAASSCSFSGSPAGDEGSDTLRIAISSDLSNLNPWMTRTVAPDLSILSQIYSPLVVRDNDLKLKPALATSWEQVTDRTWRFHLRTGVTYSNGKPFNAEVVKWNIDKVLDDSTKARVKATFVGVTGVQVRDEVTVDITSAKPNTTIPAGLTSMFFLEPSWAQTHDPSTEAMGTGPYNLVSWRKQSSIVLKRRDAGYWGTAPAFGNVEYRVIPETSSQIASLRTGEVDLITGFGSDQLAGLHGASDITSGALSTTRSAFLYADTTKAPMKDVRVRQAVNYAINKQAIVDSLLGGNTKVSPSGQVLTPEYGGYNDKVEPYPYDPAMARRLLAESGHAHGLKIEFKFPAATYLFADQIVQAITAQLAQVGITAHTSSMPKAEYTDMNYARTSLPDLGYLTYSWWTLDGADLLANFAGGGAQQFWSNARFDNLITKALASPDQAQRDGYTLQAVQVMHDDAGFIFLFPQPLTYAYNSHLAYTPRPDDWLRASDIGKKS